MTKKISFRVFNLCDLFSLFMFSNQSTFSDIDTLIFANLQIFKYLLFNHSIFGVVKPSNLFNVLEVQFFRCFDLQILKL